jgi:hypothetical protein
MAAALAVLWQASAPEIAIAFALGSLAGAGYAPLIAKARAQRRQERIARALCPSGLTSSPSPCRLG